MDLDGIYHRVFKAAIETPPGEDCNGIVLLSEDGLELIGAGRLTSTSVLFPRFSKIRA